MMKSVFAFALLGSILVILLLSIDVKEDLIVLSHYNPEKKPLEIDLEKYACSECGTPIRSLFNSSQAIMQDGTTYFFDDLGCLCLWLNRQKEKDSITVWVYTEDTERYILAQNAWYSRTTASPIGYGFGAYEIRLYGKADYYFDEIRLFAIRGETMLHPMINALLLENKI